MCGKGVNILKHRWLELKFVQPLWKAIWQYLLQLKYVYPDSTFLLLGIYSREILAHVDIHLASL